MGKRRVKTYTPIRSIEERNALVEKWRFLPGALLEEFTRTAFLRYRIMRLGVDDAIAEMYLAIIRAAETWDENRKYGFYMYARKMCCFRVYRFLNKPPLFSRTEAMASGHKTKNQSVMKAYSRAWQLELMTHKELEQAHVQARGPLSRPKNTEHYLSEFVSNAMRFLTPMQQLYVHEYYWNGKTLRDIGRENKRTAEGVRQVLIKAERKIYDVLFWKQHEYYCR